ncbi:hypothetical protein BHM03_00055811 [Ensete ventricosum]|nr:hypothetical protein BHM03_00055811 [Ensete ventricosum]
MEFRNPGETGIPSSSSGYNASLGVRSAFSKPTLSPSSSLVSPRGAAVDGGGVGGGPRNGYIPGNTKPAAPPSNLVSNLTALNHRPRSLGNNADQASISISSPGAAGVGVSVNSEPAASATTTMTAADIPTKYKECLRNHAAALGGHVVDGCCEFMPNGDPDTPDAIKCAACGCHRSFHRRETNGGTNAANSYYHGTTRLPLSLPPPHPHHHQKHFQLSGFSSSSSPALPGSPAFVHFGGNNPSGNGGTTTESSSEEMIDTGTPTPSGMPKKRFRTKFTAEQKEKMLAFAERWRIQRQDDAVVEQFCSEVGVRRQVLKVWMHNNKHMITRKQQRRQQL